MGQHRSERLPRGVPTRVNGEEELIAPKTGDPLGEFYERNIGRTVALAYGLTGDRALAEDLAQEAFIRVAGRFGHLRDPDAAAPYLRRTVVNLTKKHYRRSGRERRHLAQQSHSQGAEPIAPSDDRDTVWALLLALPYRQRAALVLRYFEDLSEAQTAETLHCSTRAVNALVARGMSSLRRAVKEEGS